MLSFLLLCGQSRLVIPSHAGRWMLASRIDAMETRIPSCVSTTRADTLHVHSSSFETYGGYGDGTPCIPALHDEPYRHIWWFSGYGNGMRPLNVPNLYTTNPEDITWYVVERLRLRNASRVSSLHDKPKSCLVLKRIR